VFLVFWRQQVVKTVGAGTKTSKQGPSCPPPDPYKRNKTHKKLVFCFKIVFFKNASRIIFASQLLSVFCGFWQAIWRTPKIKRPSFGEKRGGGSENTRFSQFWHFFETVCFSNFEGATKGRPEPSKVIRAASISIAFRKNTCFSLVVCVFVFDAKCEKHEVAQGPGPHRSARGPPKTKQLPVRFQRIPCFRKQTPKT
jgi:hypothetical protein